MPVTVEPRPKLLDAVRAVMANREMKAFDVVIALAQSGYQMRTSNPTAFISYFLSSRKETFKRVRHGVYRVKNATPPSDCWSRLLEAPHG